MNAIVDEDGVLLRRMDYDVFGAERATGWDSGINNANASSNRMKFSGAVGHVGEPDAGLIYMRARYYDPSLGRFISEDPAQSGTNWYTYCGNNPVNAVDPTGQIMYAVVDVIGVILSLLGGWYSEQKLNEHDIAVWCGVAAGAFTAHGIMSTIATYGYGTPNDLMRTIRHGIEQLLTAKQTESMDAWTAIGYHMVEAELAGDYAWYGDREDG